MSLTPSPGYSITIRLKIRNRPGSLGRLTTAIGRIGGDIGAVDIVHVGHDVLTRDVTVNAASVVHGEQIVAAIGSVDGVEVINVSDRTFLMHLGGKIEVRSKVPLHTRADLSMAYTPGVARVCEAIHNDPEQAFTLTIKKNTVAVVSDGTAVLGLGDIGPFAAMPVMEGKAMLFKEFAGIDAFPICLDTKDPDEIVRVVKAIAPGFGAINLEDISAPRCFEIEDRLRHELPIPVFHDDQHGTAVVVLAALINALKLVGKRMSDIKVVVSGVGAAGVACSKIIMASGVRRIVGCDRDGIIHRGRGPMNSMKRWYAEHTNPDDERGSIQTAMDGADVFLGLVGTWRDWGERSPADGRASDRFCHGQPDARNHARAGRAACHRHGYGPVRLSQPDQQRALLPGHLSWRARCPGLVYQRGDEVGGGPCDRRHHRPR